MKEICIGIITAIIILPVIMAIIFGDDNDWDSSNNSID